jgi:ligand-binding SRPBCC domain-containing protein
VRTRSLCRKQVIDRPRSEIFRFFGDAQNLAKITPPELRFRITTPHPIVMRAGALIDYRLALFGIPFSWQTRISHWEPDACFVDEQLKGPYRSWVHRHSFREAGGMTEMVDCVSYSLPFGTAGQLAAPIVSRQLDQIFDFRSRAIRSIFA